MARQPYGRLSASIVLVASCWPRERSTMVFRLLKGSTAPTIAKDGVPGTCFSPSSTGTGGSGEVTKWEIDIVEKKEEKCLLGMEEMFSTPEKYLPEGLTILVVATCCFLMFTTVCLVLSVYY